MAKKKKVQAKRATKRTTKRKKSTTVLDKGEIYIHPDLSTKLDELEQVDPAMADWVVRSILGDVKTPNIKSVRILPLSHDVKRVRSPWDKDCT